MTTSNTELLATLNAFREQNGLAPFADWRKARHQPMLDAYKAAAAEAALLEEKLAKSSDAPKSKLPAYKVLARQSADKSTVAKPVEIVHSFCDQNAHLSRKEAVAALVGMGINYSTARTQYQKWFTARKG